jgi:pimeloyl-[acyl-carrier protein] methyl ester esterase
VLLTGWGMSCHVWDRIIPVLQRRYQINCVSPPWVLNDDTNHTLKNFDAYIDGLAEELHTPAIIVAWSFSGLVAIQLASRYPSLVAGIVFISSSAKFVADKDHVGIDAGWFLKFKKDFSSRPQKTLQKFYMLVNHGDENVEEAASFLKLVSTMDQLDIRECTCALDQLGGLNLYEQLSQLSCSTSFIHGENDAILTIDAARFAAKQANSHLFVVNEAGHAPHISHPFEVAELISQVIPA